MATQDAPQKHTDNSNTNSKDESKNSNLQDQAAKLLSSPKDPQDKQPESSPSQGGFLHQVKLFGEGLVSGSVFNAVNGVTQLADHVLHTNIGTHLQFSNQNEVDNSLAGKIGEAAGTATDPAALVGTKEGMLFTEGVISGSVFNAVNGVAQLFGGSGSTLQLDNQKEVDGSWAGKAGEVVGTGADMVGLTLATGGVAGAAGLTGYGALALSAGSAGAIEGGIFTPSSSGSNLLTSRLESAAIGGFAGAAGVGAGAGINALAKGLEGSITSAAVRIGGNTVAGAMTGAAPLEISSLWNNGTLAPLDANLALAISAGAVGGAMAGLGARSRGSESADAATDSSATTNKGAASTEIAKPAAAKPLNGQGYPERAEVAPGSTWNNLDPGYKPQEYTAQSVIANDHTVNPKGWADAVDPTQSVNAQKPNFNSYEPNVQIGADGRPLNPEGPTGISGRGLLGKWGPNHAADPIVTRIGEDGKLEGLLVLRQDTIRDGQSGQWALPGGMVDKGEMITATLKRELGEETSTHLDFDNASQVYKGYVVDPRNTDNAWMETDARHLHLQDGSGIVPKGGDDAAAAKWTTLDDKTLSSLYGDHQKLVRQAISNWEKESGSSVDADGTVHGAPETSTAAALEHPTFTNKEGKVFNYYDDGQQPPAEPMMEYRAKATSAEHAEIADKPFKWIDWQGNQMDGAAGDWKVTAKSGSIRSVAPDIFKQTYEETSPGSGMYLKTAITRAEKLTAPAAVKTLEGTGTGEANDYLVTGPKGERYIVSNNFFEGKYDKVAGKPNQPVQETPPEGKDFPRSAPPEAVSQPKISAVPGSLAQTDGTVAMLINSDFAPGGAVDGAMLDAMGNDHLYQNARAEFTRRTQLPADDPAYIDPKNPDGKAIVVDVSPEDRGNAKLSRAVFVIDNFKDDADLGAYTKAAIDAADAAANPGDTLSFSLFRGGVGGALTGTTERAAITGMRDGMLEAKPQNIGQYNVVFYDHGTPNDPRIAPYIQVRNDALNGR